MTPNKETAESKKEIVPGKIGAKLPNQKLVVTDHANNGKVDSKHTLLANCIIIWQSGASCEAFPPSPLLAGVSGASGCGGEAKAEAANAKEYRARGFEPYLFNSTSTDAQTAAAKQHGLNMKAISDPGCKLAEIFGVTTFTFTNDKGEKETRYNRATHVYEDGILTKIFITLPASDSVDDSKKAALENAGLVAEYILAKPKLAKTASESASSGFGDPTSASTKLRTDQPQVNVTATEKTQANAKTRDDSHTAGIPAVKPGSERRLTP